MAWSINTISKASSTDNFTISEKASSTDNWDNLGGRAGIDFWDRVLLKWEDMTNRTYEEFYLTADSSSWTISDSGATDGES